MIEVGIKTQAWMAPHGDWCAKLCVFKRGRPMCAEEGSLADAIAEKLQAMVDATNQAVVEAGMATQFSDGTLAILGPDREPVQLVTTTENTEIAEKDGGM